MKKVLSLFLSFVFAVGICASAPITANAASLDDFKFELKSDGKSYSVSAKSSNIAGELVIPCTYNGLPVTSIAKGAFLDCCNIVSVLIPDTVQSIGHRAFENCKSLESVIIPDSVQSIGSATFKSCTSLTSVKLPANLTKISNSMFSCCSSLSEIVFPSNITTIEGFAFQQCNSLSSIVIPDGVAIIEEGAFECCISLVNITLPNTLQTIGDQAFCECYKLSTIKLPSSIIEMGERAFERCVSLEEITLPENLKTIGYTCFLYCLSLKNINVLPKNNFYSSLDGVLFDKNKTQLIHYPARKADVSYTIPSTVRYIEDGGFYRASLLKNVIIPESVEIIGESAFEYCTSLSSVTMGGNLSEIKINAFGSCSALESLYINDIFNWCQIDFAYSKEYEGPGGGSYEGYFSNPAWYAQKIYVGNKTPIDIELNNTVSKISSAAFFNFKTLESITIPDSVISIGNASFRNCENLKSVTMGKRVTTIGDSAFEFCSSLTEIRIPENVTTIEDDTFMYCGNLTKLNGGENILSVGDSAFYSCNIKDLDNFKSLKIIKDNAFRGCSFDNLVIPDNIIDIGEYAFADCLFLTNVTLPDNLHEVGDNVFFNSPLLASFVVGENNPVYSSVDGVLFNKNQTKLLHYPVGKSDVSYTVPNTVTCIDEGAFYSSQFLQKVIIPDSVTTIANRAFEACLKLAEVNIPKNVSIIGDYAFHQCPIKGKLILPDTIRKLGTGAFSNCLIDEIVIPDTLEKMGDNPFEFTPYYWLEENWENGVLYVGNYLIEAKTEITDYIIKDGVIGIACDAFSHSNIKNIQFPHSLKFIGAEVFTDCQSLTKVVLPEGVEYIYDNAFYGCEYLNEITIPDSVKSIGVDAFLGCIGLSIINIKDITKWCNIDFAPNKLDAVDSYFSNPLGFAGTLYINGKPQNEVIIPDGVTEIKNGAFFRCVTLNSITLPTTLKSIGDYSFAACVNLKTVNFNESQEVWDEIKIGEYNNELLMADIVCLPPPHTTHTYNITTLKSSTCTVNGVKTYTCVGCGETKEEIIPATGHTEIVVPAVTATCINTGLTEGKKCSVCNTILVGQQVTPKAEHKTTLVGAKPATFEADGHTGNKVCTVCNQTINVGSVIPKLTLNTPTVTGVATNSGIQINWNAVENAQGYVLYKRVYDAGTKKWGKWQVINNNVTDVTYLDTDVTLGTSYRYTARAKYGSALSGYTSSATIKYNVTPTVKVANASNGIKVSWSTAANATGYTVYRSTYSNGKWSGWKNMGTAKANKTAWTDKNVKSGVAYKYTVRAAYGKVLSSYNKNGASVVFLNTPTVKIANNASGIKVAWNKIAGAQGYVIYSSQYDPATNKWSGWANRGTVNTNSWIDTYAQSGVTYKYTVRALNGKSLSAYVSSGALMYLAQPTVTIANASKGINVSWSQSAGATGYTVYRSEYDAKTKKWSSWKSRGTAAADKSSWVDKKVTSGKYYKYTVRAINGNTKSTYVSSKSLYYLAEPVTTVTVVDNGINVAWTQCAGAKGYTVYSSQYDPATNTWSNWKNRGTAKANKNNWTDTKAVQGVTYKYAVRAVNGKLKSSYTETAGVTR